MKCPVCRATYRGAGVRSQEPGVRSQEDKRDGGDGEAKLHPTPHTPTPNTPTSPHPTPHTHSCRRCGADLTPLIQLHDQAVWYYRNAIAAFQAGDYATATEWNQQALAIYSSNADFHTFAGQLWALQGEFGRAIASWKEALQLNPQHPTARTFWNILKD